MIADLLAGIGFVAAVFIGGPILLGLVIFAIAPFVKGKPHAATRR